MKIKQLSVATFATLLIAGSLVAQETQPPKTANQSRANPAQATAVDSPTKDQTFAKCLAIANQEQVLISRFAKDKTTNADVKAFAATLEEAHQTCFEKLEGLSQPSEPIANTTNSSFTRVDDKDSKVDFLQLHQEISTQCLKDSKEMLSSKNGIEFDQCFVGMQIAKHAGAHSTLTVLQRLTTGKLQEFIVSGLETNAKHMDVAVNLMEKLAKGDSSNTTRDSR